MHRCVGMSTPWGRNISLYSMGYRFSFEADLGCPEMKEEGAFHSRRNVIYLVPRTRVFVRARVGAMA